VLRKRKEVTGEWKQLPAGELHNFYSFTVLYRYMRMRWAGHLTLMGMSKHTQDFGGETRRQEATWIT
jgi:hypothetical protein